MALMLVGIGLIGTVTSTLTSYFLNTQRKNTKNQTIEMIKNQLDHFEQLSDEDVEIICNILKSLKNRTVSKSSNHFPVFLPFEPNQKKEYFIPISVRDVD